MDLSNRYLGRMAFDSYEDYYENLQVKIPKNFNFAYDVVDEIAMAEPGKTAMVWCNDKGSEAVFTFEEVKDKSEKAAIFFTRLGIKKGDKVMLVLKRHYEFWFCLLGLHRIGAVAIPATHLLTPKDFVYRNNAADIKMIVTVNEEEVLKHVDASVSESPSLKLRAVVGGNREGWIDYDAAIEGIKEDFERPTDNDANINEDMMLLYFTSGTTGMPKMVQHDFTYPLGHVNTAKYWHNVADGGLHLTVADTGWAKAMWGKIYGQWICGCAVFIYDYDKFVPSELLGVVSRHRVTSFCAPPTIYRFLIKEDLKQYDLSALKDCSIAGEPLNPEVYHQFLNTTGLKLREIYGQTEMTVTIGTFIFMEPRPGSMGKPAPGYDIALYREDGTICGTGEEGQIGVATGTRKPVGMFGGYYKDEELTKKVWHDDVYLTGDMAWRDEEGYYWFLGRSDDVIKSSGYRIGPFEVESALLEHPAVLECAITAVPDEERGQIVKATVVLAKGYVESDVLREELKDHVKKVTAPYKYPRIIEFVEELPKTISGKIRRVEIRERDTE